MNSGKENRINNIMETALKNLNSLVDVNTVVGKPIKTDDGDYIVPVCKITLGVLVGGGEYGKINIFKKSEDLPFSAGNGAIISIKPSGFLVKENNSYKVLSVSGTPYETLLEKTTDIIEKLKIEQE